MLNKKKLKTGAPKRRRFFGKWFQLSYDDGEYLHYERGGIRVELWRVADSGQACAKIWLMSDYEILGVGNGHDADEVIAIAKAEKRASKYIKRLFSVVGGDCDE